MRDGFGDFGGGEPVNVLSRAAAHAYFELHRTEVNSDRLRRLVADEYFDREDADRKRIGLAEFFFRAGGVGVGVGNDGEAFVAVFSGGRCGWRGCWAG